MSIKRTIALIAGLFLAAVLLANVFGSDEAAMKECQKVQSFNACAEAIFG